MKCNRPNNHGKTSRTPRRPFEKERLNKELEICGFYGRKQKQS